MQGATPRQHQVAEEIDDRGFRAEIDRFLSRLGTVRIEKLQQARNVVFSDVLNPDTQSVTFAGFGRKMMELRGIGWIREKGSDSQWLELCRDVQVPGQEGRQEGSVLD